MISSNQRSAIAALDAARPIVARLDTALHPDDVAADLIEGWSAVETALRSLLGSSGLAGQALVSEVRQRGLLDYGHAHALLGFLAARDRASRTDYRPTETDVDAARSGFQAIEAALGVGIGADTATYPAVRVSSAPGGMPPAPPLPPPPLQRAPSAAPSPHAPPPPRAASPSPTAAPPEAYVPASTPVARRRGPGLMLGLLALALLAAVGAWAFMRNRSSSLDEGIVAFQQGNRVVARRHFEQAAMDQPKLARPHIYLARLARDDGDRARANSELTTAINLEPTNALALREMGQLQLQANNLPLAVRFLERALRIDATDKVAAGWMGCALQRQGQADLAGRFFQRAGTGDWTACQQTAPAYPPGALPPGALPPGAVPSGAVPPGGGLPAPNPTFPRP